MTRRLRPGQPDTLRGLRWGIARGNPLPVDRGRNDAARVYAGNRDLAALAVAGSVGAGLADRFSDLELDCYWIRPPADADRLAPVDALGGELSVTVSNFLVSSVERFVDDVVLRASTDPVTHTRLAAVLAEPILSSGGISSSATASPPTSSPCPRRSAPASRSRW